jgi:hypothetical protein
MQRSTLSFVRRRDMSPRDEAALSLYQSTKNQDRAVAESMLEHFFTFPSLADYERDLDVIRKCLERKS